MPEPRWQPTLGAFPEATHTRFRAWAPGHRTVSVLEDRNDEYHRP
jgi:1,4-alpha-glucan branching enzyme